MHTCPIARKRGRWGIGGGGGVDIGSLVTTSHSHNWLWRSIPPRPSLGLSHRVHSTFRDPDEKSLETPVQRVARQRGQLPQLYFCVDVGRSA